MVLTHWLARNKGHRRMYDIFMWVVDRCNNKNNRAYIKYWWRWIKCERKNVEEFFKDMRDSYKKHVEEFWEKNTTLDRIDVNWNYCKENCRWATWDIQQNNRRNNLYIEIDWTIYNSEEFAVKYWLPKAIASHRICDYLHWRCTFENMIKQWQQYERNMTVNIDWEEYDSKDIVRISWCHITTAIKRIHKYKDWKITKDQLLEKPKDRYLRKNGYDV